MQRSMVCLAVLHLPQGLERQQLVVHHQVMQPQQRKSGSENSPASQSFMSLPIFKNWA